MKFSAYFPSLNHTEELEIEIHKTEPPKNIFLANEIIKAIQENKFNVYSFSHVTEVVPEILKIPMGKIEKDGKYTPDSILRRIEDRLEKKKEVEKDA